MTAALPARCLLLGRELIAIGIIMRDPINGSGARAKRNKTNADTALASLEKSRRFDGRFGLRFGA
jgi:hypothetical protein